MFDLRSFGGVMAGETEIVYNVPTQRAEPNGPVATGWLLSLWIIGTWAAAGGLTWTWLMPPRWLSSGVVLSWAVMVGAPLFLMSWAYLANADGFRHRPFLVLAGLWLLISTGPMMSIVADVESLMPLLFGAPMMSVVAREDGLMPLLLAVLPLISCVAMVRVVLSVRLGQQFARGRPKLMVSRSHSPRQNG